MTVIINTKEQVQDVVTTSMAVYVPTTTTVNGHALSSNVAVSKSDVSLGNVDNTSDVSKPVSTAQQSAIDLKAPIASPTFTGTVSGITKTMVGLSSVANLDTSTTANITDSSNKRFVTDAQQTILGNTSGTNTGNQSSIVGITGTVAQFNTAISDGDMATGGGTATGTNTGDQTITLTTDVTGSGTGSFATTIAAGVVTLAKMATMATASLIYRRTAGAGVPEVNTLAQLKTDLALAASDVGLGNVTNESKATMFTSAALTSTPTSPTAAVDTNTTQIASTAYVVGQGYAKLASPTFSGTPSLPTGTTATTQSAADSTTKLATTAFATTADNLKANLASPTFTGTVTLPASTSLTTPVIGAATGTSLAVTGAITSSGAGIGYATGAGGTVSQGTSRVTGVTLSKLSGTITLFSATLAADTDVSFTWTNTFIAATDVVVFNVKSGAAVKGGYSINTICGAGSATVTVHNLTPTITATEAPVLQFVVIKGIAA